MFSSAGEVDDAALGVAVKKNRSEKPSAFLGSSSPRVGTAQIQAEGAAMTALPIERLDQFYVYGVANDYDALIEFVRYRVEELQTTHESIDAAAKLQGGYSGKILAPTPIKSMGKVSMGPMLQSLGLALIVVRDDAQFAAIKDRLAKRERPRQPSNAGTTRPRWLFTKRKAREMGKKRFSLMSDAERKRFQRKAGKASGKARRRKARDRPP
jgi:hypothetical protein